MQNAFAFDSPAHISGAGGGEWRKSVQSRTATTSTEAAAATEAVAVAETPFCAATVTLHATTHN